MVTKEIKKKYVRKFVCKFLDYVIYNIKNDKFKIKTVVTQNVVGSLDIEVLLLYKDYIVHRKNIRYYTKINRGGVL